MLHYILQTIAFQLFFLIIYDAFLKKETFFNWNRAYLLITALLSVVLPFIKIEQFKDVVPQQFIIRLPEVIIGNLTPTESNLLIENSLEKVSEFVFSWELFLGIGIAIAFMVFIYKLLKIAFLIYKNPKYWQNNLRIVKLINSNAAFSFFHYVFLGELINTEDKEAIIKHESIHVRQKHTIDLLVFEMLRIVFWFNPLVYMYQNRVRTLHEYIADAKAVKILDRSTYYENLLAQVFETQNVSFINTFFKQSLIKKRIIMLSKSRSKQIFKLKYMLLLPLIFGMLLYTSCNQETELETQSDTLDLRQYSYSMKIGEEMSEEIRKVHNKYEEFLLANSNYVSWVQFSENTVAYSVHPIGEKVPENLEELKVRFPNDSYYITYIDLSSKSSHKSKLETQEVPFAVIDEVPVYPSCETLATNAERRKCMAEKITKHVQQNFNTDLAGDIGLIGRQRINVVFKIDADGNVTGIRSRAPHPRLEEEAIRVISLLPKMSPGKQNGEAVIVPYSLPIIFQVQ